MIAKEKCGYCGNWFDKGLQRNHREAIQTGNAGSKFCFHCWDAVAETWSFTDADNRAIGASWEPLGWLVGANYLNPRGYTSYHRVSRGVKYRKRYNLLGIAIKKPRKPKKETVITGKKAEVIAQASYNLAKISGRPATVSYYKHGVDY
jgi:hypothetical protein